MQKYDKEKFIYDTSLLEFFSRANNVRPLSRRRQPTHCVHWFIPPRARVSRASRAWRARATKGRAKAGGFALSEISTIPRVRTYHTKKPSRFVHALSARPLKVQSGRESNMCADGIKRYHIMDTSSVSLWLPPSPTGEGWQNAELLPK